MKTEVGSSPNRGATIVFHGHRSPTGLCKEDGERNSGAKQDCFHSVDSGMYGRLGER